MTAITSAQGIFCDDIAGKDRVGAVVREKIHRVSRVIIFDGTSAAAPGPYSPLKVKKPHDEFNALKLILSPSTRVKLDEIILHSANWNRSTGIYSTPW